MGYDMTWIFPDLGFNGLFQEMEPTPEVESAIERLAQMVGADDYVIWKSFRATLSGECLRAHNVALAWASGRLDRDDISRLVDGAFDVGLGIGIGRMISHDCGPLQLELLLIEGQTPIVRH